MKKDTICAVPWMHLNFEPNGKVVPCCLTSVHNYFAGDLTTQTIDEIWNSDNMKLLRKQMINGEKPEICRKCFEREEVTGESGRYYQNKEFPDVLDKIPNITLPDGTCTEMKLQYWDFRFSNLCNFKCRSCGPRYSSSWVPDAKKLGIINEQEKVWYIQNVDQTTNFEFLEDQINNVKKIYFAGGEPLLMDEHWQILELLVKNKKFDVKLNYNTNCSTLIYNKQNVIDYWQQWEFGKLEVWPSIDEIGERAELIRAGTDWSKVEENLKELATYDNIIIRPGITVGAWNVFRLPEIITYLNDIGVLRKKLNYNNFFINLLEHPTHYHVHILPYAYRKHIIHKLESFITEYNSKYNTSLDHLFTHIIHELKKPESIHDVKRFIDITTQVDKIRNEKLFEVIPEMNVITMSDTEINSFIDNTSLLKPIGNPIVHDSKNVIEIKKHSKPIILTWMINNICTNRCSYCPPGVHSGRNHHYDWVHAKNFINNCFTKYGNIHCNLSGGEPTVSPFFKELVNLIYDNGGTVLITTNLVRSKEYWDNIAHKLCSISASYHPEYVNTAEKEEEFFDKVKFISTKTYITVRVMMHPDYWEQCLNFYIRMCSFNCCNVEMVRILPNFGIGENYCNIDYTYEQDELLNITKPYIVNKNLKSIRNDPTYSVIKYEDGSTVDLSFDVTSIIQNSESNNFENWECNIGLESLFVHYDGRVQRGNCHVGGFIGNITSSINWPTSSIICNKTSCHCIADLLISKRIVK